LIIDFLKVFLLNVNGISPGASGASNDTNTKAWSDDAGNSVSPITEMN